MTEQVAYTIYKSLFKILNNPEIFKGEIIWYEEFASK